MHVGYCEVYIYTFRSFLLPMQSCGVCVSVTFVHCVKTNKDSFEIFFTWGSQTILVFPYQTGWRYSDGNPPNGDVECRWGRQKSRFYAYMPAVDAATDEVSSTWSVWNTATISQVVTLISLVVYCGYSTTKRDA